jgi:hypothetical protein
MKHIPLDKSWAIRCLCLDIIHGYTDAKSILSGYELSDDIENALGACLNWNVSDEIFVGESGTLYRFLKYINIVKKTKKKFIITGTLLNRNISDDKSVVNLGIKDLLTFENNTSQWASAAYLCGVKFDTSMEVPYKLQLTVEAVKHWNERRKAGKAWEPRLDPTIENQAKAFIAMRNGENIDWTPSHSEDYCFARVFGLITSDEGLKRWPNLTNHETNRIDEMENAIKTFECDQTCISKDHRVVQAMTMFALVKGFPITTKHIDAVNKSWPEFWKFIGCVF